MLGAENRLTKDREFRDVYRAGRPFSVDFLSVTHSPNQGRTARIGIVVSTKFSKSAVKRNRVRRQIREVVRKNFSKLEGGHDIVISLQPRKVGKRTEFSSGEIEKTLLEIFKKNKLIKS